MNDSTASKTILLEMKDEHKDSLLKILKTHVPELEVWAFGSRVRWTARETSDLDITLRNPENINDPLDWKLINRLNDLFEESDLPFLVDILDWATVSEKFKKVIEREYVVIQSPDKQRAAMRHKGWKKYKFHEILKVPLKNGITKPTKIRGTGFKMVNLDQLIRARVNRDIASPEYIFYYFKSYIGRSKIKALVDFIAAEGIRSSDLSNLDIELPPLPTQRRIVAILSVLDEKIELNRQTNATLEAIAQAIFKEWSLDFRFSGATVMIMPPLTILQSFENTVQALIDNIEHNYLHSATLAQIRDILLPKLMNGEIEVL
jgi:type I restriction enzyme, S subunit